MQLRSWIADARAFGARALHPGYALPRRCTRAAGHGHRVSQEIARVKQERSVRVDVTRSDEHAAEQIRRATSGGFVPGPARFAQEIARAPGRRVERGKPGRPARAKESVAR